ncbi:MAG: hypothetical protein GXO57_08795 [Thermodesulfobacteria bacterium]|nr:hypothetical protein [Thermodesulfobacteriota bacterium]
MPRKRIILVFVVISVCFSNVTWGGGFPPWFYEPGDVGAPGALGFANLSFYGKTHSQLLARCRALKGLCEVKNWKCNLNCTYFKTKKELEKEVKKVVLIHKVKFDDFQTKLVFYESVPVFISHAYLKRLKSFKFVKDCKACSFKKCKPIYLCNPLVEGYAGSIGSSEISFNVLMQYQLALKRAIELFAYLNQVDVRVSEVKEIIRTNLSAFKLKLKEAKLTPFGKLNKIRLLVRSICINKNGRMYVYIISPDIKVRSVYYQTPCWLENRFCLGGYVAVGSARENINGFYAQVKQAVYNALIELAKSKGLKVKDQMLKITRIDSFGRFKLVFENTFTGTKQVIKAKLIGIYKKGNTVYAGVMEVKP